MPVFVIHDVVCVYLKCQTLFQLCAVCGDPFEQYWDEEAEEWHLRNAISISGKVGCSTVMFLIFSECFATDRFVLLVSWGLIDHRMEKYFRLPKQNLKLTWDCWYSPCKVLHIWDLNTICFSLAIWHVKSCCPSWKVA